MTPFVVGLLMVLHTSMTPAGAGAVAGLVVTSGRGRPVEPVRERKVASPLVLTAVIATLASGVVHAVAGPHHAEESLLFGCFFYVSACVQFLWSTVALLAPSRRVWWSGIWVSVGLVLLWAVTRTTGLPGLLPREEVGPWDLASKVWEVITVVCCALLLAERPAGARPGQNAHMRGGRLVYSFLAVSVVALLVLATMGPPE